MAKKAKKAANGSGTLRKRSDGSWEGRFVAGYDKDGKPIRKSVYARTKDDCAEKLRKATTEVDEGTYLEPSTLTVKQWFDIWLSEYMAAVKPLTVQQYRSMAESHIIPALGRTKLIKLTAPQLQKFFNQLAVDGKKTRRKNPETGKMEIVGAGEPLSTKTIRNIYDILSKALNTAVSQKIIKENIVRLVVIPKVIQKEVKPLDEDMQKSFIEAVQKHKYRNLYLVYLFCGLRESEAIGLTWDSFDAVKGTLKIYRQWQRTPGKWSQFRFEPLKNNKTRTITLSPVVVSILKAQEAKQIQERFVAGRLWEGWDDDKERLGAADDDKARNFIFTDEIGKPLNPAPVYENFKKIAAEIGIPAARVHDLRHSFAVNSLAEGDSPKTVQENLGHHSAAFTLDVYGHVSDRMKEESAKRQQLIAERLGLKNA